MGEGVKGGSGGEGRGRICTLLLAHSRHERAKTHLPKLCA